MGENPKSLEYSSAHFRSSSYFPLVLQGGLLLITFLLLFAHTIPPLYKDWLEFKQFSHGLLVPFISAYLVWRKRNELLATPIKSSSWGALLILPSVGLALTGRAIGDAFSERVGMVLCVNGLVWLLFGWAVFKRLIFPLAYLFLMIPFPYFVVKEVAYQLRILDASAAAPMLRLLGIPVYRETYYLHLPDITLEVADLCSGISSVFSLFALGGAYVFFTPMRPKLKLIAVLSTFPFAVLINLLRIIITAALSYYVGLFVLNMLIHELTGTITFFIALALFIVLCEVMQSRFSRKLTCSAEVKSSAIITAGVQPLSSSSHHINSWLPSILAMTILIMSLYFTSNLSGQRAPRLITDLSSIGVRLAGYQKNESKGAGFYQDPGAETEISRNYSLPAGEPVEVYIGFSGKQEDDKRLHSPKLRFPYGWNYVWLESANVPTGGSPPLISGNWMLTQNNQTRVLVLYWYQNGDDTYSGEVEKRWYLIRNSLLHRRSDVAVVRLATRLGDSENIDQAKSRLTQVAADLYLQLHQVLPQ